MAFRKNLNNYPKRVVPSLTPNVINHVQVVDDDGRTVSSYGYCSPEVVKPNLPDPESFNLETSLRSGKNLEARKVNLSDSNDPETIKMLHHESINFLTTETNEQI